MQYHILLETEDWGQVLYSSKNYKDALIYFELKYEEINKREKPIDMFFLQTNFSYHIDNHRNLILDFLERKTEDIFSIYLIETDEDFDFTKLIRQYPFYSATLEITDGIIIMNTILN